MSLELSGTTGVKGVAGSVSAPSIVGDDTNTGISFPSADTIKFSTGGVERMQITNSGVSGTGIGAGKILQVVQGHITSSVTINSDTFTDIVSASITPSATTSKVLCLVNFHPKTNGSTAAFLFSAKVLRDSTTIVNDNEMFQANNDYTANVQMCSYSILDEPSSTSSLTYKLQARRNASATGRVMYFEASSSSSGDYWKTHTITLMEVGA